MLFYYGHNVRITANLFFQEMAMRKVTRTQFEEDDDDMVR